VIHPFFSPKVALPPGHALVARPLAFEAAHAYRGEAFGRARRVHGHNYVLTVAVSGPIDPSTHMVVDIRDIDRILEQAVAALDHRRLDVEFAPLGEREACVEALAAALFRGLSSEVGDSFPGAKLAALRVAETDELWADHYGGDIVELTRAYSFSAAHRLARPGHDADEERAVYGKCANPHPHGHDYRFEVTVAGRPDAQTGLVTDIARLDEAVARRIIEPFDHRYLNEEVEPFDRVVPTAERIAERIWELLASEIGGLDRVVVYETPRSAFTYRGR
jgi:6-pyruvoyltetrahydropterin/6-carboxytetrahydropterin synthase